jgi:hypothetical protein
LVIEGVNGFCFDPTAEGDLEQVLLKMEKRRDHWDEMGQASKTIIASWNLNLFAESFWRACATATSVERRRGAAADLVLSRLL